MATSLIICNFFLCAFGGFLCVCRMTKTGPDTKVVIRFQYVMWFTVFAASGISWLYYWPANLPQLFMGGALVAHLLMGLGAWRDQAPAYAMKSTP